MGLGSFLPTSARLALGRSGGPWIGGGRAVTDEPRDENTPALIPVSDVNVVPDGSSGHVFSHTSVYQRRGRRRSLRRAVQRCWTDGLPMWTNRHGKPRALLQSG